MLRTGGYRPSGCKGTDNGGSGQGRGEEKRRYGAVGEDGQELMTWDIT